MVSGQSFLDQWAGTVAGPFWRPESAAGAGSAAPCWEAATEPSDGLAGRCAGGGASARTVAWTRIRASAAAPHRIPEAFLTANLLDGPETVPKFQNGYDLEPKLRPGTDRLGAEIWR